MSYGYKVSTLDIRRNFTAVAKKGGFFYIDVCSTIMPYQGKDIKEGFYYVETENYFPLKGNQFYDYQVVDECSKRNIISKADVKYFIEGIPSDDIEKCLNSFIYFIYKTSIEDKVKKYH